MLLFLVVFEDLPDNTQKMIFEWLGEIIPCKKVMLLTCFISFSEWFGNIGTQLATNLPPKPPKATTSLSRDDIYNGRGPAWQ